MSDSHERLLRIVQPITPPHRGMWWVTLADALKETREGRACLTPHRLQRMESDQKLADFFAHQDPAFWGFVSLAMGEHSSLRCAVYDDGGAA